MAELNKVEDALARFEAALRRFEAAVTKATEEAGAGSGTHQEVVALRDDRARLASEMDAVRAKADELAEKNRAAVTRIDGAMAKIRAVFGG